MYYGNELELICDTLNKCHVRTLLTTGRELTFLTDVGLQSVFGEKTIGEIFSRILPKTLAEKTVYKLSDAFGLRYITFLLSSDFGNKLLFIGPYLSNLQTSSSLLEIGESVGISPKRLRHLQEYYMSLPVLSETSHLFSMIDSFCERIWHSPSFAIVDLNEKYPNVAAPINEPFNESNFDDTLVSMKTMEKRYEFENEMIEAVSLGQLHKEKHLLSSFSDAFFEQRLTDQLRNAKNYCIIMNTLLRKAAEKGGVHPLYIDRVSSDFASKIELLPSLSENSGLMREMFRSYCRLVRKHSTGKYSLTVQKTMLLIDSDISADLSLKALAAAQGVSCGYLSTIFKKETGKTVSEYIRERRINHAIHLLETTQLQIQTVALHCGIVDVQYFSKLFKKQTGKTPKEFRESFFSG